jgi:hypothetical protein
MKTKTKSDYSVEQRLDILEESMIQLIGLIMEVFKVENLLSGKEQKNLTMFG